MTRNAQAKGSSIQRFLIVVLAIALIAMLGTALVQRLQNPTLTEHRNPAASQPGPGASMPQGKEGNNQVGALMQKVAQNPKDMDALLQLAEALAHEGNWQAAETFAQRASVLDLNNSKPLFMLGIVLHNLGREAEAAQALEKALALKDTARVRYSLGVLYLYFLDQKDKGLACMEAGLKDPSIEPDIKEAIEQELHKFRTETPANAK